MNDSFTHIFPLDSPSELELINVKAELVTYRGRSALRLLEQNMMSDEQSIAILPDSNFKDGVIETELAGTPRADAPMEMRGFVGIAFRVQPYGSRFECFYLRPTNGRADDQLRRNHSTQYCSQPDYPWFRLREENPSVYESMWISLPENGRRSRSLCLESAHNCMSTVQSNRASSSMT